MHALVGAFPAHHLYFLSGQHILIEFRGLGAQFSLRLIDVCRI